ncbi:MAG TPA: acetyl-CoA carboxylase carboxyl transferase subunit beta [Bdellovibrionales bacterium]|nr:MAG: acetyl-CoA carboxylase subunit beta [Bdellovibrionales bacterium GWB1_52_6]OFZ03696.1 MAG: acetyl-CoA carboxylase subunit beta [Bdellovibrionales bacterium GWA1_52_35]OFZ37474.1 MAG: acetyl-CoA carboxylase subunit beta [Bdellovibrionales bacterium GWC1_52_8]HAR44052.1 acetyl-CoA carboxylase carboxyl transferase subunit beta [Bdellovibrionales bacterium]HCM38793.1 acetyl-CoA carboxylase carboxyl transferase subunit beta [Bdellovibrionales bacterium]
MPWFDDLKTPRIRTQVSSQRTSKVPEGLWVKCTQCGEILQSKILKDNLQVCPECSLHFRMIVTDRISVLTDEGAFEEYAEDLVSTDPLEFDDTKPYKDRLRSAAGTTGLRDACVVGKAKLGGLPYHLGVFEFKFMGGSMGVVVGEKVTRLFESALQDRLPAVVVSASGGARMQEGILSLMQMARTTAAISQLRAEGIPYISILTDPTTGGVTASFAMLGDVILAEPGALIGFAGPRVIEQTIRQSLPPGFQRSEFLLKHGFVDRIVARKDLAQELRRLMWFLGRQTCRFPTA